MTKVVHCKKEPYDVYIGRPSFWGNPFKIGADGTRDEVIEKYRAWVNSDAGFHVRSIIHLLRNKTLGCYCHPLPCHGDILAELADK